MLNFAALLRAFDAALVLGDAVKRLRRTGEDAPPAPAAPLQAGEAVGPQLEARLTSVVVAALKEAFDRDHARLELERAQIEEHRRRTEEALRLEQRRQAVERELGRLRLLAGAALVGWMASVALTVSRLAEAPDGVRAVVAVGWLLLIGACGAAFSAQRRLDGGVPDDEQPRARGADAALWMLVGGLALSTLSLLLA